MSEVACTTQGLTSLATYVRQFTEYCLFTSTPALLYPVIWQCGQVMVFTAMKFNKVFPGLHPGQQTNIPNNTHSTGTASHSRMLCFPFMTGKCMYYTSLCRNISNPGCQIRTIFSNSITQG